MITLKCCSYFTVAPLIYDLTDVPASVLCEDSSFQRADPLRVEQPDNSICHNESRMTRHYVPGPLFGALFFLFVFIYSPW